MAANILVVEDDADTAHLVASALRKADHGFEVTVAPTGEVGLRRIVERSIDCVILDYRLPDADGIRLLARIRRRHRHLPVILFTALGSEEVAVEAMKLGATDYIAKHGNYLATLPFLVQEALGLKQLARATGERPDSGEIPATRSGRAVSGLLEGFRKSGIVGESPAIERALDLAERAAHSSIPVLLEGETGTGKELLARVIHERGPRAPGPFLAQNCAALSEYLLESELFGHVRGAFTGADRDHKGLFEVTAGGSLFLDEIGETSLAVQSKLLRVLQSGEFRPVGSTSTRRADVRVIAATNRDLEEEAREGRFRLDLYYRLRVFPIRVPPLRERREDIEPLALHFLGVLAAREGKRIPCFEPDTLLCLGRYAWPGNVRELENEIHRLVLCAEPGESISPTLLSARLQSAASAGSPKPEPLKAILRHVEAATIRKRLREYGYSRTATARSLGIARETLWVKLRQLGISIPRRD